MLKQLKDTKHGVPLVDDEDVTLSFKGTNEEKREWIMSEMIFAFETKVGDLRDWEEQFSSGNWDKRWKKLEDGNYEMVKGENDTHEIDWEGRKAYQERISNGFRLFGKYYESLWS